MAKKVEEKVDYSSLDFEVDTTPMEEVRTPVNTVKVEKEPEATKPVRQREVPQVNVLRNERVVVRFLPKGSGIWGDNPRHILGGGMAEGAARFFTVPKLRSGVYVNVLTNDEKTFLEEAMGLDYNTLSVLKTVNNYWDNKMVRLTKGDNYLDLSSPDEYIKYKILLANKDFIAPSLQALQDSPKATYQFVLIAEGEENKQAKDNMSTVMRCYKEYGKVEDNADTLRVIIESIDGRPTAPNSKLEFLQTRVNSLIQADSKLFLRVITDPYLSTKVLIKRAVDAGIIANRDNHYYMREDNSPLCGPSEESTFNVAARYLNMPKHQDLLFAIQAKLKD